MILKNNNTYNIPHTGFQLPAGMPLCQSDYPLDWYQEAFIPYAKEYLALPNRHFQTIVDWMAPYIEAAQAHFGNELLLLAHYYMGGEIVKLIEQFGGYVGDSYQLSLIAAKHPEKSIIVESAVHFMAEAVSLLAHPHQRIYITNPKAGCTMEMLAKDFMVEPAFQALNERYGAENILPICYMNTSGRLKAMTGAQGGAVCTSSNVKRIFEWAMTKNKKILFIPDRHMGENVAGWVGIPPDKIAQWPGGTAGAQYDLLAQEEQTLKRFDEAQLILFGSECGVHAYYQPAMVQYWQEKGYNVVVHPECRKITVDVADAAGSTAFIWDHVINDRASTQKYAIGTENHMVENLKWAAKAKNITVVNVADVKLPGHPSGIGCGCATMSRNDPPHLVALLDLLRQGKVPEYNEVKAGDVVNEFTGQRQRLSENDQQAVMKNAKKALENMIRITEG
ncbi:MAG: nadA [Gammaproteobacteria bacterium]|jgi:quinolinate synthase|nr:nadA [Gammaproteobacteria bacterium]